MFASHRVYNFLQAGYVLILIVSACAIPSQVFAANTPAQASTIDPDGDDERTELLYHWQDKRFSDEERHQILTCSLLITTVFLGGVAQRKIRRNRCVK